MHDETSEPRVPGGPLAIGGLHPLAWIFILLALVDLVWFIVNADSAQITSLADAVFYGLQVLPAVAAILFPAALLARHPDATTRAPVLLLGTILFALVQVLLLLATPLAPYFEASTPASQEVPFVAMAELYNGLTLAVAAVALGFIARGLSLARWYEDRTGPWIDWLVPLATAFATVFGIVGATRLEVGDAVPLIIPIYIGSSVILGILRVAAWAYLLASALRGVAAGEDPRAGWQLAALAGGIVLFALVLINLVALVAVPADRVIDLYQWTVVLAYALGHVLLLTAFTIGLPSLDPEDDDYIGYDEDNDEGFEDEEAGFEGGPVYDDEFPEEGIRQARSVGSAETRLRRKFSPSSTRFDRSVRAGHQDARPAGQRDARQVAPRLRELATGTGVRHALVDEDDGCRAPDGDLLPERTDPGGQRRIGGFVASRRDLEQVGDAVAGGHQGVIGGLDRRPVRDDPGRHQASPERLPEPALVVVARRDADRRGVEPDEQQPIAERRQVLERLDLLAVDDGRDSMRSRPGALAEVGQVVGEHAAEGFGVEVLALARRFRPAGRRWCRSAACRRWCVPGSLPGPWWPRSSPP